MNDISNNYEFGYLQWYANLISLMELRFKPIPSHYYCVVVICRHFCWSADTCLIMLDIIVFLFAVLSTTTLICSTNDYIVCFINPAAATSSSSRFQCWRDYSITVC